MIKNQLEEVRKHIEDACRRAGRNPEEVTLIAVSKTTRSHAYGGL